MLNKCCFIGNLGQDPELKTTSGGTSVCNFSIACTRKWVDGGGAKKEDTQWIKLVVWGKQGEACAKYLTKGKQCYIEGRMQTRSYDKDGRKCYVTEIVADQVIFLGGKSDSGGQRQEEAPPLDDQDIPF
jgi:single-strand DNA-binding protein